MLNAAPLVSATIPCFNAAGHLERAVNSVLSQTFTDLECIVVDDGSTDGSRHIAQELAQKDERVKYFHKANGGLGSARNFGITQARGRWIQMLDADDLLFPGKIEAQLKAVAGRSDLSQTVLYSDYEVAWEDDEGNVVKQEGVVVGRSDNRQLVGRMMSGGFSADIPLHANNTLVSRDIFEAKRFNENLKAFVDMEFWIDVLVNQQVEFIYTPVIGMSYRKHAHNLTNDPNKIRHAYVDYLKEVYAKKPQLLKMTPHVGRLVALALENGDKPLVARLADLVDQTAAPVYIDRDGKIDAGTLLVKLHKAGLLFILAKIWHRSSQKARRFFPPHDAKAGR